MLHHWMIVYLSHLIISSSTTLRYIKFWVDPNKLESDTTPVNYKAIFKSRPENNCHYIIAADPGFQITLYIKAVLPKDCNKYLATTSSKMSPSRTNKGQSLDANQQAKRVSFETLDQSKLKIKWKEFLWVLEIRKTNTLRITYAIANSKNVFFGIGWICSLSTLHAIP